MLRNCLGARAWTAQFESLQPGFRTLPPRRPLCAGTCGSSFECTSTRDDATCARPAHMRHGTQPR
eukprot:3019267-Pyramimonas_sp.AAC.1